MFTCKCRIYWTIQHYSDVFRPWLTPQVDHPRCFTIDTSLALLCAWLDKPTASHAQCCGQAGHRGGKSRAHGVPSSPGSRSNGVFGRYKCVQWCNSILYIYKHNIHNICIYIIYVYTEYMYIDTYIYTSYNICIYIHIHTINYTCSIYIWLYMWVVWGQTLLPS